MLPCIVLLVLLLVVLLLILRVSVGSAVAGCWSALMKSPSCCVCALGCPSPLVAAQRLWPRVLCMHDCCHPPLSAATTKVGATSWCQLVPAAKCTTQLQGSTVGALPCCCMLLM